MGFRRAREQYNAPVQCSVWCCIEAVQQRLHVSLRRQANSASGCMWYSLPQSSLLPAWCQAQPIARSACKVATGTSAQCSKADLWHRTSLYGTLSCKILQRWHTVAVILCCGFGVPTDSEGQLRPSKRPKFALQKHHLGLNGAFWPTSVSLS